MSQVIPNMKVTAVDPTAAGVPPSSPQARPAAPGTAAAASPAAPAPAPRSPDDFIPVSPGGAPGAGQGAPVRDLEAEAAQEYRQRIAELQASQKHLEEEAQKLREAAKADGYRDGFRMGEEKAELQARQQAAQVFGKVNELIGEFSGLKHAILDNVQQNFYELCQAMAEALLKREFSIRPDAFVTVLRRAIAEAVEPGKVRIRVHPDFYDKIVGLGDDTIRQSLVKDVEIPAGDFKVESDQSIVDVSIGKLIEGLLAKADLNLFGEEEKAS
jgi:flagellar biosynthesis/type III secretory pathway protein FliH